MTEARVLGRLGLALVALAGPRPPELAAQCGGGGYARRSLRDSMLVAPRWLAEHLESLNLVVLHVARERAAYDSAHVPGARFVPYSAFTVTRDSILTELPPVDRLVQLLEGLGVSDRSRVVLYGEILGAARMFFTLDYLGHGDQAAILNGGLPGWRAAGLSVSTASPPPPPPAPPARFTPHLRPDVVVDAAWVRDRLLDPTVSLVDARSAEEYRGEREEEGVTRPGHIPGALQLDWVTLVTESQLHPPDSLRALLGGAGVAPNQEIVTYCRVGTRSSLLYFVARYLGWKTRVYDGSLNDWSRRAELPVVRGPARR